MTAIQSPQDEVAEVIIWDVAINSGHRPLVPRGGGKVYLLNYHESGWVFEDLEKIIKHQFEAVLETFKSRTRASDGERHPGLLKANLSKPICLSQSV